VNHKVGSTISIGRPIDNTQFYILDKQMNPTPIGVTGELYIGGDGLSEGYLGRDDLTAERFVRNPFCGECPQSSAMIYQTGDLARYLPSGDVECLGRIDNQVKVRGFRIELGDIETVLQALLGVTNAVVDVYVKGSDNQVLIAYVTLAEAATLDTKTMRRQLRERLPAYMVPSKLITLEKMPLTPNGKINRAALPKPSSDDELVNDYVAPSSATELALDEIWSDLMGVEKLRHSDLFFELGGHSLLATQVISRAHVKFDVQLDLRVQFEEPSIRVIAALLDEALLEKQLLQVTESEDDEVFDI
jgi:hypothetical protein